MGFVLLPIANWCQKKGHTTIGSLIVTAIVIVCVTQCHGVLSLRIAMSVWHGFLLHMQMPTVSLSMFSIWLGLIMINNNEQKYFGGKGKDTERKTVSTAPYCSHDSVRFCQSR